MAEVWLDRLRELGFTWITLHPDFAVSDTVPPVIDTGRVPDSAPVIAPARARGFRIRMEPHLDWTATLTGGPYEWRRRMYLNPLDQYLDKVLLPLARLLPDELTLGSELDVSSYEFAAEWSEVAARVRPLGISIGHKLNHDWKTARDSIRAEANAERARRGLPSRWPIRYGVPLEWFLRELDYVAISYYALPGTLELDEEYTVGEFGLGSPDVTRPWHSDKSGFLTEEGLAIRREFYFSTLQWLGQRRQGRPASFWTVEQFDVLGLMWPEWRDEAIVEAVREYNRRAAYASP